MEDALYETESIRHFAGLKLDRLPDETTILKLHHFLERHGLGEVLFNEVNKHLERSGLMMREGSIVDATIISVPSSTNVHGASGPPGSCCTGTNNRCPVMPDILELKSGMSISTAKTYPGLSPGFQAPGKRWMTEN